ncbi:MAG: YheU family protein [Pseudomonadales bacterium]|nr:YheU family protein [Pseudomonadales bacterium]MBL6807833.1 YheU family protein [Pseudomonadales bacterium]MDA0955181.1 YheU family protein [Pseudomonadota bacterium]
MPLAIPLEALDEDTLRAILEAFVSEEGTDYGHRDYTLDEKVRSVRGQLEKGEAVLCFDEATESVTVVPRDQAPVP